MGIFHQTNAFCQKEYSKKLSTLFLVKISFLVAFFLHKNKFCKVVSSLEMDYKSRRRSARGFMRDFCKIFTNVTNLWIWGEMTSVYFKEVKYIYAGKKKKEEFTFYPSCNHRIWYFQCFQLRQWEKHDVMKMFYNGYVTRQLLIYFHIISLTKQCIDSSSGIWELSVHT